MTDSELFTFIGEQLQDEDKIESLRESMGSHKVSKLIADLREAAAHMETWTVCEPEPEVSDDPSDS